MQRDHRRPKHYDFVLSFAGEDRRYVSEVDTFLRFFGARVFYDEKERSFLVGQNLYEHFGDIYERRGSYCVMFVSKHYVRQNWPRHERRFAQARALVSPSAYILPVRLDSSDCPGLPRTTGYIDGRALSPSAVATILMQKLGHILSTQDADEFLVRRSTRWQVSWNGSVRATVTQLQVHLGDRPAKRMKFNLWSCDGRPLQLQTLAASDKVGQLRTQIVGNTLARKECALYLRRALQFGDSVDLKKRFSFSNYYRNVTSLCKDTFRASVPIHDWYYEFIFPKGSQLVTIETLRTIGRRSFRAAHTISKRAGRPIVSFSFREPRVGTVLSLAFQLQRPQGGQHSMAVDA